MKAKQKKSPLYQMQNRENKIGKCEMCLQERELTVDHIFPCSLLERWGLKENTYNDEDNFQLICKPCNILKKDRFDFNNKKTIYLIEKYINLIKTLY